MNELKALGLKARLESLITEREGMIAENKQREHLGQSMAYSAEHFNELCDRFSEIESEIRRS